MTFLPMDLEKKLKSSLEAALERGDGKTPPHLAEAIRYSLLSPGKRIRPRLTLACASMLGLRQEAAIPAALALEMIHCFTLIHDDLPCMDNDDVRRGRPSNHKKFGEALALLAGDSLTPLALDAFMEAESHVPATHLLRAMRRLLWAAGPRGVIGGQAAESLITPHSGLEELRRMHAMKTGALFSAALLIPKDMAGLSDESSEGLALEMFAAELGLAFQAADDLEDAPAHPDPVNILYFLSPAEARTLTTQRLRTATKGITSIWNQKASPLVQIAEEVLRKIEDTKESETPAPKTTGRATAGAGARSAKGSAATRSTKRIS